MKRILVPTDFSLNAEKALEYALHLGSHFSSEIILLHSWELPHQKSAMFVSTQDLIKEKAENDLNELKDKIALRFPDLKISTMVMMGDAAASIKTAAKNKGADYIVMGTKGASGLKKIFMGSITTDVLEDAPCPVMAIPEKAEFRNIKNIGYATDLSSYKLQDALKTIPLAKIFNAKIVIIYISINHEQNEQIQFEEFIKRFKNITEYENIEPYFSSGNDVVKNLQKFMDEKNIDILSLTRRKRDFYEDLFHTSVSKEIAYSSTIPLIIYQGEENLVN
jgi:nucleotide-binding universal stress UspA family protein